MQSALTVRNHLPSTAGSQALDWRPENVSQMMAGIQEVGWVSTCQIPLLQGSFTGILQLRLFPCFWKTPEIGQFTFMDHSKALCKSVKITVLKIIILQFKTTNWKTFFKQKQGIFQFVLCYLKTGTFFSEGLIKLWGIIGKSEKSSRLCHLYSQELKRVLVYKTTGTF